jgi:SAM-dependent methyltransferase
MDNDLDRVRASWEQRAVESGASLSGVLLRNLSENANRTLDEWHATILRDALLPEVRTGARVLDLGCGYGRLSRVIASARPDIDVVGQDLSLTYCRRYLSSAGPCVVADVALSPFTGASFDALLSVTCLMYVPRENAQDALRGTYMSVALLLDGARELQDSIARLLRGRAASPTGGTGFRRDEYRELAGNAGLRVLKQGGNPALSLGLLVPGVAKSRSRIVISLLNALGAWDRNGGYSRFALHRWLLVRRDAEQA